MGVDILFDFPGIALRRRPAISRVPLKSIPVALLWPFGHLGPGRASQSTRHDSTVRVLARFSALPESGFSLSQKPYRASSLSQWRRARNPTASSEPRTIGAGTNNCWRAAEAEPMFRIPAPAAIEAIAYCSGRRGFSIGSFNADSAEDAERGIRNIGSSSAAVKRLWV